MKTMETYVALLRGINVGGNKKVEMKKLKALFEKAGYMNVQTYINSGNVLFRTDKSARGLQESIEEMLEDAFGFEIRVVIRDHASLQKICKETPARWENDDDQKTDILFLYDGFDAKNSLKLLKINPSVDILLCMPGAIVWHLDRKNYNKSGMSDFIGTTLYKNMTARNVNTVRKLEMLMKKMTIEK